MSIIGMTYIDRLSLRWEQWGVLLLCSLYPTWWGPWCVLLAFWNQPAGTDHRLFFQECRYLRRFSWSQCLSEMSQRNYVNLQNPFVVYCVSRFPVFLAWQIGAFLLMKDVTPTPLSLLMMTQPSPDLISFLLIRSSWQSATQSNMIAAVSFGVGCIIKSSALVVLPVMGFRLKGWILLSLVMLGIYWMWLSRHHAGKLQLQFLVHLGYGAHRRGNPYRQHVRGRFRAIRRRWKHYKGGDVLLSLIVYLFPAYLSFSWGQWAVFALISCVAPNAKYYLVSCYE